MSILFPTWKEYEAASEDEQRLFWVVLIETWRNNADDQIAADIRFDRSEEMREWVDEYTSIGDDRQRIIQSGRMSVIRNRGTKSMNTPARTIKGDIVESVIMKGDLSRLTPAERVEYYSRVCQSIGLNPLTQPFAYMTLNGKMTLYAKRDAADQLRKINGISIEIVSREVIDGIYTVHVRAKDPLGRTDEDFGVVAIPDTLKGEARANAILKAVTKAKRRVTLSISGLGLMDETEVEDVPGARQMPDRVEDYKQHLVSKAGPGGTPVYDYDPNSGEIHEPSTAQADSGVAGEAAASQNHNAPHSESAAATDEFPPDSTARFIAGVREHIMREPDYKKLVSWWNSKAEIKKRSDFGLTQAQLDDLKAEIMQRRPAENGG